ncbi:MAG TPA: hypothetical protein VGK74_19675 [Symbiobacteriaceae bacterium]
MRRLLALVVVVLAISAIAETASAGFGDIIGTRSYSVITVGSTGPSTTGPRGECSLRALCSASRRLVDVQGLLCQMGR